MAFSGSFSGTDAKSASVSVGGNGGSGGIGGEVDVTSTGTIKTLGDNAIGIEAQSVGGGGGNGGLAAAVTFGGGATDPENQSTQIDVAVGGTGGSGNIGGTVNVVNTGLVTTTGEQAYGIEAQSLGGGGGDGGASLAGAVILGANKEGANTAVAISVGGKGGTGGNGGTVTVNQNGGVGTSGDGASAIFAQSVGGGGGDGGSSRSFTQMLGAPCPPDTPKCASQNKSLSLTLGGNGGASGDGGTVTVTNQGAIVTIGDDADGIEAQSVGGGGGTGGNALLGTGLGPAVTLSGKDRGQFGKSVTIAVGGTGGASGDGGNVTINNTGTITTSGNTSYGVLAQSVGGGGGIGGDGVVGVTGKLGIGGGGGAAGDGGIINVTQNGDIATSGDGATAIFAQSVGGGGGIAGNVDRGLANSMSEAGVTIPSVDIGVGLAFGQPGGGGGDGGKVTVTMNGNITTTGIGADGIFAQSVGGGGGAAGTLGNTIGGTAILGWTGSVGGTGNGGEINVTENGNILAFGDYATGIYAQSAGGQGLGGAITVNLNGGSEAFGLDGVGIFAQSIGQQGDGGVTINIGANGAAVGGHGADAAGILISNGIQHTINNAGAIFTLDSVNGTAVSAVDGATTINNTGIIEGSLYLGTDDNQINNNAGGSIYLGSYANNSESTITNNTGALLEVVKGTLDNQNANSNGFVNNGGVINVFQTGTVATTTDDGVFTQIAGTTNVDGNWTQALTNLTGGQLKGAGTVNGTVYNNANPGTAPANQGSHAGIDGNGLTLTGLVTGTGNYGGVVNFDGEFSPGTVTSSIANPNVGGATAAFSTDPNYYPAGTGSAVTVYGQTMNFQANNTTFLDLGSAGSDKIVADTVNLGGTLTIAPTDPVAGSTTLIQASGNGSGITGDFALAQMLNMGNNSDLYLTRTVTNDAYTTTLRSTLADYGVAVDNTFTQIGGQGASEGAPGNDVIADLRTTTGSATLATGGAGFNDGPGGNGGVGNAINIVVGSGNSLAVGTGGNGGFGTGSAPNGFGGKGGTGIATSTFIGITGSSNALATGGTGGNATGNDIAGLGGNATATATTVALSNANANATATGGDAGVAHFGITPAGGGAANATAILAATSGVAKANAATPGNGPDLRVTAQATSNVVNDATVAQATTNIGGNFQAPVTPFNNTTATNAFAFATGLPNTASLTAALASDPKNQATWANSFVAGTGLLGAVFPAGGTVGTPHTFDTQIAFDFSIPSGYGSTLTIGLLNGTAFNAANFNAATDSLSFTITDNSNTIFTDSFTSLADAVSFFTDDLLTFDPLVGVDNTIDVDMSLVTINNVGFQGNVVVGTVPEPTTWLILLTALLGWTGIAWRKRQKAAGAKANA